MRNQRLLQLITLALLILPNSSEDDWSIPLFKFLYNCREHGNAIVWRAGNSWEVQTYNRSAASNCSRMINGVEFIAMSFDGEGVFKTTGWYGYQNWVMMGHFNKVGNYVQFA
ncbi:uncharacterized protein LOC112347667 [Selaginella moellendorffii]|uniref:uncharacterized protein LOC112347667 n=1 Tax=Selaginella moellendorffii TaxID=88036 RepID=UPI000D1C3D23|nr:uncharacterized protein LOC112347667 [Selaginella moellendorffii]|eukprot:XP_024534696.1 uncharacterized protein LOC112347667 [Selaginella moellendorffii]